MIRPSNEDPRSAQDASAQLAASATQPGISREDSIDGARRIHLVAHGLREPLRTVTGYLDLVAEGSEKLLDEETRAHVDRALDGARRLRSRI
jgi:signal transduction histidine kinase